MNGVLKAGLMSLGASAACFLLLAVLGQLGVVKGGPCGFDAFGSVLFFGFLIGGGLGVLLTAAGFLQKVFRKAQA